MGILKFYQKIVATGGIQGDIIGDTGSISTAELADLAVTEPKVALASLTGLVAALIADANVIGGLMVIHRILLASGADADVDVLLTHKTRIVDAVFTLNGAGTTGSDIQVFNVTTAISDLLDVSSGSDNDVFRPGNMDSAQVEIAAAANLRVSYSSTSADFPGAEGYIIGMRVA